MVTSFLRMMATVSTTDSRRGILIVLEGCDRTGKSTQSQKLVKSLHSKNIPVQEMHFPDRSTSIGQQIDKYLTNKTDMDDRSIHLLFSANRWELESKIRTSLLSGTTLVVDRYVYSGVAFTAAKQIAPLEWCKGPDQGLPQPDIVFYLHLSPKEAQKRADYGNERYEKASFQERVAGIYKDLQDNTWCVIDASQTVDSIHEQILTKTLEKLQANQDSPIKKLWI